MGDLEKDPGTTRSPGGRQAFQPDYGHAQVISGKLGRLFGLELTRAPAHNRTHATPTRGSSPAPLTPSAVLSVLECDMRAIDTGE